MPKILLVEDDNNLREIFQMRLEAEGYQTVTAADGEEGLVVAMKERPDLIIADVMMPKLSGFEMVENLRSAPEMKDTKVIMMTALGQAEDQARGEKLGVVKYLVKSQVTLEDFAGVVKGVLGPGDPSAVAAAPQVTNPTSNNQGSEGPMQPQDTPNPMPAGNDSPAPASDPAATPAPDASSAPAPMSDAGQQTTAEEQAAVDSQVNDFANSPAPSADASVPPMPPATDQPQDAPVAPAEPPASTGEAPAGDDAAKNAL
jgi:CheY-like chemotaxis protein